MVSDALGDPEDDGWRHLMRGVALRAELAAPSLERVSVY
jgi:hypothetical protein